MKIKETALRPNPGGFGWADYTRVRELADGETVPSGAVSADDAAPVSDWTMVPAALANPYPGAIVPASTPVVSTLVDGGTV